MVSCTSNFAKRVDLIVSVLTTKTNKQSKTKGPRKLQEVLGLFCYCDGGDGVTGVCIYPNSSRFT